MVEYIPIYCNTTVCCGRIGLKILVSDSYEMCKYLNRESNKMFAEPFMRW